MKTLIHYLSLCSMVLLAIATTASAQEQQAERGRSLRSGDQRQPAGPGPRQPVPVVPASGMADVILGRPTASSVTLSIMRYDRDSRVIVSYGLRESDSSNRTGVLPLKKGQTQEVTLNRLLANKHYSFSVRDAENGNSLISGSFHTARPVGDAFVFTITPASSARLP